MKRPLGESDYFETYTQYGLYLKALDWCIREAGRYLPASWSIPDQVIRAWGARRTANELVATGVWEHDDYERVYRFIYIDEECAPQAIRDTRKKDREKKSRQRRQTTILPGQAPVTGVTEVNVPRGVPQGQWFAGTVAEEEACTSD